MEVLLEVLPRVLPEIGVLWGVLPRVLREIGGALSGAPLKARRFPGALSGALPRALPRISHFSTPVPGGWDCKTTVNFKKHNNIKRRTVKLINAPPPPKKKKYIYIYTHVYELHVTYFGEC